MTTHRTSNFWPRLIEKSVSDYYMRIQVMANLYTDHLYHSIKTDHDQKVQNIFKVQKLPQLAGWDWHGVPKIHWSFVLWEYFTTIYLTYSFIKNAFTRVIDEQILGPLGLSLSYPLSCYLPGKFYFYALPLIDRPTAMVIALVHLIWRKFQYDHKQEMTTHYFLLFTRRDLNKYNFLASQCRMEHFLQSLRFSKCPMTQEQQLVECFFHNNLSYAFPITDNIHFNRLRPNRTRRDNENLRLMITYASLISTFLTLSIASVLTPIIFMQIISEKHYKKYYPKCGVEAFWFQFDSTGSIFSMVNIYRLFLLSLDTLENLVLWWETGVSLFFGIELATVINFDLIVYWRKLHNKTIELNKYLKLDNLNLVSGLTADQTVQTTTSTTRQKGATSAPSSPINRTRRNETDQLNQVVRELQFQLHDFFKQIKQSDAYMSDVLTLCLLIWFSTFLLYIYMSLGDYKYAPVFLIHLGLASASNYDPTASNIIALIVLVPMLVVTMVFWSLLALHRRCMLTYRYLCPILARYKSQQKASFLPILDYFSERRTCFSLFRMAPFLPTTYLSIVGWSFSCFFVLRTLFGQ